MVEERIDKRQKEECVAMTFCFSRQCTQLVWLLFISHAAEAGQTTAFFDFYSLILYANYFLSSLSFFLSSSLLLYPLSFS